MSERDRVTPEELAAWEKLAEALTVERLGQKIDRISAYAVEQRDRAARLEAALRRIIRRSGRGPEVVSRIAREALENANALPKEGAAPVAEARPEGYPKDSTGAALAGGAQEGQG